MKTGRSGHFSYKKLLSCVVLCVYLRVGVADITTRDTQVHHVRHGHSLSRGPKQNDGYNGRHYRHTSHVTELPVSGADDDATAEAEDGAGSRRHVEWLVSGPDPVELMAPIELTEDEWNDAARRFSELNGDVSVSDDFRSAQPQFQSRSQTQSRQTTVDRRSDTAGRCQQIDIDARYALCCDGLIYSRTVSGGDVRCCGRVAYDGVYYACCGSGDRAVIVRRGPAMPTCCTDDRVDCPRAPSPGGYTSDRTGLGSVCCRASDVTSGGNNNWRCCLRGERCCDGSRDSSSSSSSSSGTIQIPGFRPACCPARPGGFRSPAEVETAATCCARTYEQIGLLPECCNTDQLRPICCGRQEQTRSGTTRCCAATIGYCCGQLERPVAPTRGYYPIMTTVRPSYYRTATRPTRYQQLTTAAVPTARYSFRSSSSDVALADAGYRDEAPRRSSNISTSVRQVSVTSCCRSLTVAQCCRAAAESGGASGVLVRAASPGCCRSVCCRVTHFNFSCCLQRQQTRRHYSAHTASTRGFRSDRHAGRRNYYSTSSTPVGVTVQLPVDSSGLVDANQWQHSEPETVFGAERRRDNRFSADNENEASSDHVTSTVAFSSRRHRNRSASNTHWHRETEVGGRGLEVYEATTPAAHAQNETVSTTTMVCDGTIFDAEAYICCNGSLRMRIGVSSVCCGQIAYDRFLFRCCSDGQVRMSCSADYKPRKSVWGILV